MSEKYRKAVWPYDTAERIKTMRDAGEPWRLVAESFGVDVATIRNKAKELGVFVQSNRRFTEAEDAIIRADYLSHVDLVETAANLGRSCSVIRQRIHHHHHDLVGTVRSGAATRAVKRYGSQLLEMGATPQEAAEALKKKMVAAKAAARVAAVNAKIRHNNQIIETMVEQIAAGKDRDAAIFEARSVGATLERIAECFAITRERVRQICDAEAFRMVLGPAVNHDTASAAKRDFLLVGGIEA